MKGTSDINATFDPHGTFTLAEAVTVAARVRDIYYDGQTNFHNGNPWYSAYVEYALAHGILSQQYSNYDSPASRAEFAKLLCEALPEDAFPSIRNNTTFSDVPPGAYAYSPIMRLAQAGVLGGRSEGKFEPDSTITRAEVAAVLARIVKPTLRLSD